MPWTEVVGVFPDIRDFGVDRPAEKTIYWPGRIPRLHGDSTMNAATFLIRSSRAGTESLRKEVERAVWQVNPDLPLFMVRTLDDLYRASTARTSFTLVMLAIAGGMALLLGAIGLYGVIAYTVGQRRREVGIRVALGASVAAVKGMFVKQGLALVVLGMAIGLGGAAMLARGMASLLFGVKALDAVTYTIASVVLLVAAMTACYIPARRAARVDPAETLRSE
jgi:predicted lysophospholipase L1 biosynthesis ABC-type transport system permease subunit